MAGTVKIPSQSTSKYVEAYGSSANILSQDAGRRAAAQEGSTALLRLLLRYGLKHGLPNHTPDMVAEKARQLGVSA
jgi:hypothetical protein